MSHSTLYLINEKSTRYLEEFRNGWGSGPVVWEALGNKYVGPYRNSYTDSTYMDKVWDLANNNAVPVHHRVVLMMTFDWAYVPMSKLLVAAEHCMEFYKETFNEEEGPVNHWGAFSQSLIDISVQKHSRFARGVALNCTSVSDLYGWPSKADMKKMWPIFNV